MADNDSLDQFLAAAIDAAKKAGQIIRKGFYETKHVEHKGQVDLVTETDKGCEELVFNHLKQLFPNHKLIGEETTAAYGVTELTDEPTWIVDPLDGTTNFVHGFPFVCVSIGLTIGKVPVVGVVYNPIMDELFTGVQGKGAFLNGKPIKVSTQSELVTALLVTEAGTKRDQATLDDTTNRINTLLTKVRSLRMCGSCALDLCGVACGRVDIFYELGFGGPWDIAAGIVIVKEAGGLIFDPSGKDLDITSQRIAASNSSLKEVRASTTLENPRNVGSFNRNDPNVGTGLVGAPSCGDLMSLQINVDDSASEWIKGKTLEEVLTIKNAEIAKHLRLPPVKLHCSMLAEDAIKSAVRDYKKKQSKANNAAAAGETVKAGFH
ncbi:unnamed protein product [Arabidopsis arenosa]|uniref:Inositol-1-monophosphatase n=1 Tax=Arabidopsis arenosa TaxID=38785 RepID=A0A8S1ZWI1_ARAAE|nr:unnamed protein product [Arabidopsis arenosa]